MLFKISWITENKCGWVRKIVPNTFQRLFTKQKHNMHYTCIRTIWGIYALLVLMATVSYNKNFSCNQKQNEDKITTLLCSKKVSISLKQLRRKKIYK